MRAMTAEERAAKNQIVKYLGKQGCQTFAEYMSLFDLHFIPSSQGDQVAYMIPDAGKIYINRDITDINVLSLLLRHEMMHEYLRHQQRLVNLLKKDNKLSDDAEVKISSIDHQLANIAGDYELSKFYSPDQDYKLAKNIPLNGKFLEGLVLELDHPEWMGLRFEGLFHELKKNEKEIEELIKDKFIDSIRKTVEEVSKKMSEDAKNMQKQSKEMQQQANELQKQLEKQQKECKDCQNASSAQPGEKQAQKAQNGGQQSSDANPDADSSSTDSSNTSDDKNGETSEGGVAKELKDLEQQIKELREKAADLNKKANELEEAAKDLSESSENRDADFNEPKEEDAKRQQELQDLKKYWDDLEHQKNAQKEASKRIADDLDEIDRKERIRQALADDKADQKGNKRYYKDLENKLNELRPMRQFSIDLNNMIKNQVKPSTVSTATYTRVPRSTAAISGVYRPGEREGRPKKIVPTINVYYDRSGSWSPKEKTRAGDQALATLRKKYESKGLIKVNVFYVTDTVETNPKSASGAGADGAAIVDHIIATKPDNVIILTDSDPEWYDYKSYAEIPGAVYILFYDSTSPKLASHIYGKKANRYYDLSDLSGM